VLAAAACVSVAAAPPPYGLLACGLVATSTAASS
jgi:hypothetical protein